MRLAWFSPLPPVRSGVAAYSADVLSLLGGEMTIDCFVDRPSHGERVFDAHDFLWRRRRTPYDLTVFQLGNAPCHDYMWAYLAAFPGLVVLHDARLHHARARALLLHDRPADYRAEFRFDHPGAADGVAEYAVEGLRGSIYAFWPMLRIVMLTARTVAVHNAQVAQDLRDAYPGVPVEMLRMGVPPAAVPPGDAVRVRRQLSIPDEAVVFATFGKTTAEKRIGPILRAFRELLAGGVDAYLLIIGDASEYGTFERDTTDLDRVRLIGHVADRDINAYLAAADVCLCLRWPTALETSASWLRCLAARRATIITDLAHLADVPSIDPRAPAAPSNRRAVAMTIDLLDEDRSLLLAMQRVASDSLLREELAGNGQAWSSEHHSLDGMADDYRRILGSAVERPVPAPPELPAHFREEYSQPTRLIADRFGVEIDVLRDH